MKILSNKCPMCKKIIICVEGPYSKSTEGIEIMQSGERKFVIHTACLSNFAKENTFSIDPKYIHN